MFMSTFAFILVFTTLAVESQLPNAFGSVNEAEKNDDIFGSVNEAETNDDIFGDPRKMQSGGRFRPNNQGYQPKGKLFGKKSLRVTDLIKNAPQGFENTARTQVRALVTNALEWTFEATAQEIQSTDAYWKADDFTCTVPGDYTVHPANKCQALFDMFTPTADIVTYVTIGHIAIIADTAKVTVDVLVSGDLPGVGTVKFEGLVELLVRNIAEGRWQIEQFNIMWENSGGVFDTLKSQIPMPRRLRDSIYFAKQHFTGYNPKVIVGGSAVGGLFIITIVAVWIFRKRSSYRKVDTIVVDV